MTGIYKLENKINSKGYAGQSTDIEKRFKYHQSQAKKKNPKQIIDRAIKKYGWDNFEKIIVPFSEAYLDRAERFVIATDNLLVPNGYNLTTGGCKNHHHSEESKRKNSESKMGDKNPNFGKHPTEGTRKKMSEQKIGEKHPFFGKHHTEEVKKKQSKAKIGKHRSEETKEKISKGISGEKNPMYGRTGEKSHMFGRTGEKNNMFGRTGEKHPFFGKHHTEEAKKKISGTKRKVKYANTY